MKGLTTISGYTVIEPLFAHGFRMTGTTAKISPNTLS